MLAPANRLVKNRCFCLHLNVILVIFIEKTEENIMKKLTGYLVHGAAVFGTGMLLFGLNVNAYIDPSVSTYLIQAVAGIIFAVGAALGIYFRKAKKKINKTLNIDENKGKEVESDEIILSTEDEKTESPEN